MRWLPVIAACAVGCASAKVDNGNTPPADGDTGQDSSQQPQDAAIDSPPPIDAAPVAVTLGQTNSTTVLTGRSIACANGNVTRENSYYRVFAPVEHGVTNTLHITKVTFAIERASSGTGATQPAQLKVGKYGAPVGGTSVDTNQITPINAANIQIPNGSATTMQVPITADIQAGDNFIVELAIPDGAAAGNIFFVGTNGAGETRPGYIRGPICTVISPVTMKALAASLSPPLPEPDLIMVVDGTH